MSICAKIVIRNSKVCAQSKKQIHQFNATTVRAQKHTASCLYFLPKAVERSLPAQAVVVALAQGEAVALVDGDSLNHQSGG